MSPATTTPVPGTMELVSLYPDRSGGFGVLNLDSSQVFVSLTRAGNHPGDETPAESITFVYGKFGSDYTPQGQGNAPAKGKGEFVVRDNGDGTAQAHVVPTPGAHNGAAGSPWMAMKASPIYVCATDADCASYTGAPPGSSCIDHTCESAADCSADFTPNGYPPLCGSTGLHNFYQANCGPDTHGNLDLLFDIWGAPNDIAGAADTWEAPVIAAHTAIEAKISAMDVYNPHKGGFGEGFALVITTGPGAGPSGAGLGVPDGDGLAFEVDLHHHELRVVRTLGTSRETLAESDLDANCAADNYDAFVDLDATNGSIIFTLAGDSSGSCGAIIQLGTEIPNVVAGNSRLIGITASTGDAAMAAVVTGFRIWRYDTDQGCYPY